MATTEVAARSPSHPSLLTSGAAPAYERHRPEETALYTVVCEQPETLLLAGERCRVHEYEDGRIEVCHAGKLLPFRVFFDKDPCVQPGAIVANKRLGAVLSQIRADQQERDRQRLAHPKLTLRQKDRIRAAWERADATAPL